MVEVLVGASGRSYCLGKSHKVKNAVPKKIQVDMKQSLQIKQYSVKS